MGKVKYLILPFLLSVFLLPLSLLHAQEEMEWDFDWEEDTGMLYQEYEADDTYQIDYTQDLETLAPISAGVAAVGIAIWLSVMLLALAGYIFMALALQKIGKEMDYENTWFAWIPIINTVMIYQLGEQNPWLLLIGLIPGVGALVVAIFTIIAFANISEKRGYDKVLALLVLTGIGTYILLYLLAWKPRSGQAPVQQPTPTVQPTQEHS